MKYLRKIAINYIENDNNELDDRELSRAIRDSLVAEEDATNMYEFYADKIDDNNIKEVFQDIADEERVHVGEFQQLLNSLLSDEEQMIEDGKKEVLDIENKKNE